MGHVLQQILRRNGEPRRIDRVWNTVIGKGYSLGRIGGRFKELLCRTVLVLEVPVAFGVAEGYASLNLLFVVQGFLNVDEEKSFIFNDGPANDEAKLVAAEWFVALICSRGRNIEVVLGICCVVAVGCWRLVSF